MPRGLLRFWKYEGTANDFLLVEGASADLDLDPAVVAELCDRNRGVGGDGVLLVTPASEAAKASGAGARMVVRNADGSRPEMCGNGLRCAALHVAARDGVDALIVETDAGPRGCEVERAAAGMQSSVRVDMGIVRVVDEVRVEHAGRPITLIAADAGNPHAVALEGLAEHELDALGARLQRSVPFPHGVNLERVTLARDEAGPLARVEVFERGVGRTLACGTGACAVAAVLVERGLADRDHDVRVALPGGELAIAIEPSGRVRMRGPARRVFAGEIETARALIVAAPTARGGRA